MPRACRTWQAVIPDDPAPMTQTRLTAGCRDTLAASAESGWRGLGAGSNARPRGVRGRPPVPAAEERNCRRHQHLALLALATLVSDGKNRPARTVAAIQAPTIAQRKRTANRPEAVKNRAIRNSPVSRATWRVSGGSSPGLS